MEEKSMFCFKLWFSSGLLNRKNTQLLEDLLSCKARDELWRRTIFSIICHKNALSENKQDRYGRSEYEKLGI